MDGRAEGVPDPTGGPHLNHPDGPGNVRALGFSAKQIRQIRKLTQIGRALSAERNIERLLEMIVEEAREFTDADGGALYIMSDDETELQFAIVQTETLRVRMGGTGGKITWKPVRLKKPDGSPNHENVSAHVALTGNTVNIPDVYTAGGFDFRGTKKFDTQTGYRSKSMLVVPMKNHENDIIGVLQLLNARNEERSEVISFSAECQEMTESLASQAAVALSNNRLIHNLEVLIESFIRAIATAIDEKSPYTGGHVRRVADLTMTIARKINDATDGPYADVRFSDDQMKELQTAAWLHDVGKVTTPECVVDKATKLATIFDRIELLRLRFEVCGLQARLRRLNKDADLESMAADNDDGMEPILREEFHFLSEANRGSERMSDEMMERVRTIAGRTWKLDGKMEPLLSPDEILNLNIRQGTLSAKERDIIQNHAAMTYKILSQLPFPKKMKHVPDYAAAHHEALNGRGYPRGLDATRLPLQPRILALADVFEALTAKDRPYREGKTLPDALHILTMMVKDGHIDPDLFALFQKEEIPLDYARRELSPKQSPSQG
ncbi:MAG: metal-dependent phosphohydrolase [Syntrophobacterales bacterium CG03_land_8_20_14_0_80_58_14]|nr:MAG: metal-dependent phosphohydrolase [Syntrophobacterales bacterium CG03_land_8_20_14_0_80_58_14]